MNSREKQKQYQNKLVKKIKLLEKYWEPEKYGAITEEELQELRKICSEFKKIEKKNETN